MQIKKITAVTYICIIISTGLSLVHLDSAGAATTSSHQKTTIMIGSGTYASAKVLESANPRLNCAESGEISGTYPGWRSTKAINLTMINLGNSTFGAYWCPAAAPSGQGFISYTLTSSPEGVTCETLKTQCSMPGISLKSKISIMASDQTGSYPILGPAIQNSGAITWCQEDGKSCHIGSSLDTTSTYGNEGANGVKDCTFAAVANWEHVVLGLKPDPVEINAEFATSGGLDAGLTNDQVFNYWSEIGIGGVQLKEAIPIFLDPLSVQSTVSNPAYKAIIAQLYFADGQNFAGFKLKGAFYHWVVISGFTPTGPLAMTSGVTVQMTWQQWNVEAVTAWIITTRS